MKQNEFLLCAGYVSAIYDQASGRRRQKQLDMLYEWYGEDLIEIIDSDGHEKIDAYFSYDDKKIHAAVYEGKLYTGYDSSLIQIIGRLSGTARGNREKERRSAMLIRHRLAMEWTQIPEKIMDLQANVEEHLLVLNDEAYQTFARELFAWMCECVQLRSKMSEEQKADEPFPMDDETFDEVVYNAFYQWNRNCLEGLTNAYSWLLAGSLLRNECGRVLRIFDSSFVPVFRDRSEEPSLLSRLDALLNEEAYEYIYKGDDLNRRFPGIEFYCDSCFAHLNIQEGFDDHLQSWTCKRCGREIEISERVIYHNRSDFINGREPMDMIRYHAAIQARKREKNRE